MKNDNILLALSTSYQGREISDSVMGGPKVMTMNGGRLGEMWVKKTWVVRGRDEVGKLGRRRVHHPRKVDGGRLEAST